MRLMESEAEIATAPEKSVVVRSVWQRRIFRPGLHKIH
jgi:hypothetical protein